MWMCIVREADVDIEQSFRQIANHVTIFTELHHVEV